MLVENLNRTTTNNNTWDVNRNDSVILYYQNVLTCRYFNRSKIGEALPLNTEGHWSMCNNFRDYLQDRGGTMLDGNWMCDTFGGYFYYHGKQCRLASTLQDRGGTMSD
eukprot:TRINITY_DN3126_c0_g1_i20.p1 TRINITY_DN3126_c0_g1~~TRINITY_DN3126_c0_g1_i20.p1  ORF type:complete len:108 (-),score=3.50 TRINITY_DN3126_c0_g1_i20:79-402(-)